MFAVSTADERTEEAQATADKEAKKNEQDANNLETKRSQYGVSRGTSRKNGPKTNPMLFWRSATSC